jgi:hypothetical protein
MQSKSLLLIASVIICSYTFGQKDKDEINFSDPFQVDSSEYFIIPRLIGGENTAMYGKGKGFLPWGNYRDIHFYNLNTNQTKKLFGSTLAIISTFNHRRYYYDQPKTPEIPENFLPGHIVYLAITENFSNDGGLDSDDPLYLYISSKTGDNLTQITPKGLSVQSWTTSKDKKTILVKLLNDKNGNRKFGTGDDEVYYRIDLNDDISKIKCYPIVL